MALPLNKAFTARALGVLWDNYKATLGEPPYLGRSKFGTDAQESLDLSFIKGKSGLPVALKASNFDAQAELRDSIGFATIENSMPFFRESYMVTEKEEQDYANVLNSNNNRANEILRQIAKKPLDLVRGAEVVPERMIWQLLAPTNGIPKVSLTIKGQAYTIDYMPASEEAAYRQKNFVELSGTSKWSEADTATPLDDLIKFKREFAKKTGYSLTRFSMNTETWEMVCKAEDTKKQVLGIVAYQGGIRVQESDVIAYLKDKKIEIEVYDKMYLDETGATKYFIPTGMVSAQAAGVYLGTFTYGKTPEMRSGDKATGNLSVVETGISIYTYATNHPINEHCVVSMLGLPTFEGIDTIGIMKVADEPIA